MNAIMCVMVFCCYIIATGLAEVNSAESLDHLHHKNQRPAKVPVAIDHSPENENVIIQPISQIREMIDNTETMKKGLYVLVTLSLSVLLYICYRSVKLRKTRSERRYGIQGDRESQEMRPLPLTIEDDSENENTLFNREVHMVA